MKFQRKIEKYGGAIKAWLYEAWQSRYTKLWRVCHGKNLPIREIKQYSGKMKALWCGLWRVHYGKILLVSIFLIVVFLLATCVMIPGYGDDGDDGLTGIARFARDFILFALAVVGFYIASVRSFAINKQAETDGKRHSSEVFTKGIELLAANNQKNEPAIEARIGGVYALEALAQSDPENYSASVMKMLVTYIRENAQKTKTALPVHSKETDGETITEPDQREEPALLGEDVKTAFAALKRLHDSALKKDATMKGLSFARVDFRNLRMDEIEWIDKPDLRNAKLQGADLRRAKLQGSALRWAKLQRADLSQAELQEADLGWAELQEADLGGAQLQEARLREVKLQGADLGYTELQGADLRWAELQKANLSGAQLQGADLSRAKLQGADLDWAKLHGADLGYAELQGANLGRAQLQGATLQGAYLQGTNLEGAKLSGVILVGANALYTSFLKADFETLSDKNSLEEVKNVLECLTENSRSEIFEAIQMSASIEERKGGAWKIWHSDQAIFAGHSIESLSENIEWELKPILEEISENSQKPFLQGLLRNFAEKLEEPPSPRALQCRRAVRTLKESHPDFWEALDPEWADWLSSLDEKGNEV